MLYYGNSVLLKPLKRMGRNVGEDMIMKRVNSIDGNVNWCSHLKPSMDNPQKTKIRIVIKTHSWVTT